MQHLGFHVGHESVDGVDESHHIGVQYPSPRSLHTPASVRINDLCATHKYVLYVPRVHVETRKPTQ